MSYDEKRRIIAFPDQKMGQVKLRDIDRERSRKIQAHKHPVQCIGMDYQGKYLASSSSKGTIIRIFRTDDLSCIQELRRGMDNATILSLNFSLTAELLGCSSDSGTVHVFKIMNYEANPNASFLSEVSSVGSSGSGNKKDKREKKGNRKRMTFLRKAIPYFNSEWSNTNLRIKEKIVICDFNTDNRDVIIYVKHGRLYRATKVLDKKKKEKLKIVSRINLITGVVHNVDDNRN